MCVAGEEPVDSASTGVSTDGSVPDIVVTAPRIGVLDSVADTIDWSEVGSQAALGTTFGFLAGGAIGATAGGIGAALSEIESQEGVDLVDSFEIKDDMVVVSGLPGGYLSLH